MIGHYLIFGISALLAIAFAICASALARVRDIAGFFVACLVSGGAAIVMISELLSLVHLWKPLPILVLQTVALGVVAGAARKHGDFSAVRRLPKLRRELPWAQLRTMPALIVGLSLLALTLATTFFLAVAIAPNTWDSMTYHLTRIVFWMQNSAILQYPMATERQAAFPVAGEALQGWTMIFTRGDRLVQLVQWGAQLGCLCFAWAQARDLGFSRRQAVLPVLTIAAMPVVMVQASSSQNDLIFAFLIAATLLFLLRGLRDHRGSAILAGVAGGLAFATKSSAVPLLAAVGLGALVMAGRSWRKLVLPAGALLVSALLLGSLVYGQNIANRGSLTGSRAADGVRIHSVKEIPINVSQISWQAISSIPDVSATMLGTIPGDVWGGTVGAVARKLSGDGKDVSYAIVTLRLEDRLAPGLPLLFLILPAMLIALVRPRTREERAIAIAAMTGFLAIVLTLRFNPFMGRFTMAPAILAAPLTARFGANRFAEAGVVFLLLISFVTVGISSDSKPVVGRGSILSADRATQQSQLKPDELKVIRAVDTAVPADGRLGVVVAEDSWEYPYAGVHFDRRLVRLNVKDLTPGVFDRYKLDAILISGIPKPASSLGDVKFHNTTHIVITPQ